LADEEKVWNNVVSWPETLVRGLCLIQL